MPGGAVHRREGVFGRSQNGGERFDAGRGFGAVAGVETLADLIVERIGAGRGGGREGEIARRVERQPPLGVGADEPQRHVGGIDRFGVEQVVGKRLSGLRGTGPTGHAAEIVSDRGDRGLRDLDFDLTGGAVFRIGGIQRLADLVGAAIDPGRLRRVEADDALGGKADPVDAARRDGDLRRRRRIASDRVVGQHRGRAVDGAAATPDMRAEPVGRRGKRRGGDAHGQARGVAVGRVRRLAQLVVERVVSGPGRGGEVDGAIGIEREWPVGRVGAAQEGVRGAGVDGRRQRVVRPQVDQCRGAGPSRHPGDGVVHRLDRGQGGDGDGMRVVALRMRPEDAAAARSSIRHVGIREVVDRLAVAGATDAVLERQRPARIGVLHGIAADEGQAVARLQRRGGSGLVERQPRRGADAVEAFDRHGDVLDRQVGEIDHGQADRHFLARLGGAVAIGVFEGGGEARAEHGREDGYAGRGGMTVTRGRGPTDPIADRARLPGEARRGGETQLAGRAVIEPVAFDLALARNGEPFDVLRFGIEADRAYRGLAGGVHLDRAAQIHGLQCVFGRLAGGIQLSDAVIEQDVELDRRRGGLVEDPLIGVELDRLEVAALKIERVAFQIGRIGEAHEEVVVRGAAESEGMGIGVVDLEARFRLVAVALVA